MPTYKVWVMDAKGNSRPVATCATLTEVRKTLTPERRHEYVYIFKWTPQSTKSTKSQSQNPTPQGRYLWGCISDHIHTVDLREQVRDCLRS